MKTAIKMLVMIGLVAICSPTMAGEGHDHGDGPQLAAAGGPQRQPDGSVFLPKSAQRQLGIRTIVTTEAALARTVELGGKVVMDPNAGGKVQPTMAGRIEPGPRGLPSAGQSVRKGEVLAYVIPSSGQIERANQTALIAELRATKSLAEKRLARQKDLVDTIPRKEIDATESEIASVSARISALASGLNNRDTLVAPVSGVIATANVVAGQVVDARELLFEVVDPSRLRIEALAFDSAIAADDELVAHHRARARARAVVAEEEEQRVLAQLEFIQLRHHAAHHLVHVGGHVGEVLHGLFRVLARRRGIPVGAVRRGLEGIVREDHRVVEEERHLAMTGDEVEREVIH